MKVPVKLARQWIAGEELQDALARAQEANKKGISVIINFLGEHVREEKEVEANIQENLKILEAIKKEKIRGCLSVKLTQLGLGIDKEYCLKNLEKIIKEAKALGVFVWIDMESSPYTEDTIDIYLEVLKSYRDMGVAIQSNLKRSEEDIRRLLERGGKIRLVKGAYTEKREIAYKTKKEIDENFGRIMRLLFERGDNFAIATHDDKLIRKSIEPSRLLPKNVEYQFLLGIRDELKRDLLGKGFTVYDYVPYGKNWFPYSIRRIKERKRNILLILRSIISK